MADFEVKFTGTIDRITPQNEGDMEDPVLRENFLAHDGKLSRPQGTVRAITTTLSDIPRWASRYYTVESGQVGPKTFAYTQDGKIWVINDAAKTATAVESSLNINAYPKSLLFKTANQTKMFLVDGKNLWKYDGTNDNKWERVNATDTSGNPIEPIDLIEHLDRLILISESYVFVSKNLQPEVFNDATDCIQLIVGKGIGKNLALGKIENTLFLFTTEGIYVLIGDTLSALASNFEIRLISNLKIISGRTLAKVEKALVFLADDLEIWSWDGVNETILSHKFKLKDSVNNNKDMLKKAVAEYFNNYYMLSFVEKGMVEPNMEVWWNAMPDEKGRNILDVVRGRNVSCYSKTDPTEERSFLRTGRSDISSVMETDKERQFDGVAITTRLRTRDITVKKGHNVRFDAFYPEIEPTGDNDITIQYLLDGRLSNPANSSAFFQQNQQGETKGVGLISIKNQAQFSGRVLPKINYSRGESIAFYINDSTSDVRLVMMGMGIDFTPKYRSKGKTIGA